jgi:hypothetical protein
LNPLYREILKWGCTFSASLGSFSKLLNRHVTHEFGLGNDYIKEVISGKTATRQNNFLGLLFFPPSPRA